MSRLALCLLLVGVLYGVCHAENRDEPLVVVKSGKYGYIDHEGNVLIPPKFIWADDFWRGLGTVYVCGRYVSIDRSGELHPLRIAADGHLEAKEKDSKFGFVDASGQFRIPPAFDEVLPFSDGLAAVRVGEKWGFVDASGRMAIKPRFKSAFYFRDGVGVAETEDPGFALIDKSGAVIVTGFVYVDLVSDGRVPASRGKKSGFLDLRGRVAIPFDYGQVSSFSGGLAAVEKGEKWGYVDHDGKVVIPFEFDRAGQFGNGLAPAKIGQRTGFIDKSGKFAFSLAFDYAPGFLTGDEESNLLIAPGDVSRFWTAEGRFGYVNTSGHVIWGPTDDSPDHPPLLGWSEEANAESCAGFPESIKNAVATFPGK
jgi:WG containing repeat